MSDNVIDLANLPFPNVVETVDFDLLLQARKKKFLNLWENETDKALWTARLELESEPVVKLLEENVYLELLLRERINVAAKSVMLAFATGSDLDQLGALLGVERLLIQAEDLTAHPPIGAQYESDERLRTRIQMSLEGITTAGSRGSYEYHALTASAQVKDVSISSPIPGTVQATILSSVGNGSADNTLLDTVNKALNAENVRPLCDTVLVKSAQIINYQINANIILYPSVVESVVRENVQNKLQAYISKQHKLGLDITRSGLYAALHQEGVQNVILISPQADIAINPQQVGYCTACNITLGGRDE